METNQYCTNCDKEFEPFEDVVIIGVGTIAEEVIGYYAELSDSTPLIQTLCEECSNKLLHPKPNRVAVVLDGTFEPVALATRPDGVIVTVRMEFGKGEPIEDIFGIPGKPPVKQLNIVKEEA